MNAYYYIGKGPLGIKTPEYINQIGRMDLTSDRSYPLYTADTNLEFFKLTNLGPGFALMTANIVLKNEMKIQCKCRDDLVHICFCVSGTKKIRPIRERPDERLHFSISGGECILSFSPSTDCIKYLLPGQHHAMATIMIHPLLLRQFIGDLSELRDVELRRLLTGQTGYYFNLDKMPLEARITVHQILNSDLEGDAGRLYLYSKAIELMSLQIKELIGKTATGYDKIILSSTDLDAVRKARNLLVEDTCNAPTIPQLARQTGINVLKLKAGFKRIYGLTIHGYLNKFRMEKARILISDGRLNVSETALQVGYANISHFITAYRREFGVNPGSHITELNRNRSRCLLTIRSE